MFLPKGRSIAVVIVLKSEALDFVLVVRMNGTANPRRLLASLGLGFVMSSIYFY